MVSLDGSGVSREAHAPFCERLGVRFPRPTRLQFGDDYARGRIGHIVHHLALVRHMALNLIRLDTSIKTSIKTKRLLAATSDEFRAALLGFEAPDDDEDDYD